MFCDLSRSPCKPVTGNSVLLASALSLRQRVHLLLLFRNINKLELHPVIMSFKDHLVMQIHTNSSANSSALVEDKTDAFALVFS